MASAGEASVPLVMSLLLAAFGWMFDKSITRFDDNRFLDYSTSYSWANNTGHFELKLSNVSVSGVISNVEVNVICPTRAKCLKSLDGNPPAFARFDPVEPLFADYSLKDEAPEYSESSITLPAGSKAKLSFEMAKDIQPQVIFHVSDAQASDIIISHNGSWLATIAGNYYIILGSLTVFMLVGILVYLASTLIPARRKPDDRNSKEPSGIFHVYFDIPDSPEPQ